MNLPEIINKLNNEQSQAVTLDSAQNALILAGAGSGKTRVLIHRITYLVTQKNVHLDAILAVTFTNKAANEMRERLNVSCVPVIQQNQSNHWHDNVLHTV
jgi:DNA helicase-2/ATP-dependent DNA helicase PcrA